LQGELVDALPNVTTLAKAQVAILGKDGEEVRGLCNW